MTMQEKIQQVKDKIEAVRKQYQESPLSEEPMWITKAKMIDISADAISTFEAQLIKLSAELDGGMQDAEAVYEADDNNPCKSLMEKLEELSCDLKEAEELSNKGHAILSQLQGTLANGGDPQPMLTALTEFVKGNIQIETQEDEQEMQEMLTTLDVAMKNNTPKNQL